MTQLAEEPADWGCCGGQLLEDHLAGHAQLRGQPAVALHRVDVHLMALLGDRGGKRPEPIRPPAGKAEIMAIRMALVTQLLRAETQACFEIYDRGNGSWVRTNPAITLRELVSGNIARLRNNAAVPVDLVAQAASSYGLKWTTSWLHSVENGNRVLNAEQLLLMPMVLSDALAHRVTLADLLQGEHPVTLSPQRQVTSANLRDVVTGLPSHRPFTTAAPDATTLLIAANLQAVEKMRTVREANLGNVDVRTLGQAEAGAGKAEERLAKRLGVPVIVVIAAAASLWGRSLSDERDALTNENPSDGPAIARRLSAAVSARIAEAAESARGCAEPEAVSA